MTIWLIEPRDPLIFRDGRPFGATPGARARSLPFPFPSTIAGAVRTRAGMDNTGVFQLNASIYPQSQQEHIRQRLDQLTQLAIRGPLLVQIPRGGKDITVEDWMVPAPKDAVIVRREEDKEHGDIKQLFPASSSQGKYNDLPQTEQGLSLVELQDAGAGKPNSGAPRYWTWENMQSWLLNPEDMKEHLHRPSELGHSGPGHELRTHVRIDASTRAGQEGMLFDTSGLEFTLNQGHMGQRLGKAQALGLAVIVDDESQSPDAFQLQAGLDCLGGERRIVHWRQSHCAVPACPEELVDSIVEKQACRLILLTPAYFTRGYMPSWITEPRPGTSLQTTLEAIAIDRPEVISGWDLANRHPKPIRRLAPAGTVLFLSFKKGLTQIDNPRQAITEWIHRTWMQCISDTSQDRTDGFGLAVLGIWPDEAK